MNGKWHDLTIITIYVRSIQKSAKEVFLRCVTYSLNFRLSRVGLLVLYRSSLIAGDRSSLKLGLNSHSRLYPHFRVSFAAPPLDSIRTARKTCS